MQWAISEGRKQRLFNRDMDSNNSQLTSSELLKVIQNSKIPDEIKNSAGYQTFINNIQKGNVINLDKTMAGTISAPVLVYGAATYTPYLIQQVALPTARSIIGTEATKKVLENTNLDDKTKSNLAITAGILSGGGLNKSTLTGALSYLGIESADNVTSNKLNPHFKHFLEGAAGAGLTKQWIGTTGLASKLDRVTNTLMQGGLNAGGMALAENSDIGAALSMILTPKLASHMANKSRIAAIRMQQASEGQEGNRAFQSVFNNFNWKHPFSLEYSPTKNGKYYDFDYPVSQTMYDKRSTTELLSQPGNKRLTNYNPETYKNSILLRASGFNTQPIGELIEKNKGNLAQQWGYNHGISSRRWGTDKIQVRDISEGLKVNDILNSQNFTFYNPKTKQYENYNPSMDYTIDGRRDFITRLFGTNTKGYRRMFAKNKESGDIYELGSDVWGMGSGQTNNLGSFAGNIMDGAYNYGLVTQRAQKINNKSDLTMRNQSQQAPVRLIKSNKYNKNLKKAYKAYQNIYKNLSKGQKWEEKDFKEIENLSEKEINLLQKSLETNLKIQNNSKELQKFKKELISNLGINFN